MKKLFYLLAFFMAFILPAFFGCTKEKTEVIDNIEIITNPIVKDTPFVKQNPDTCVTVTSKGRIIGWDICSRYIDSINVLGKGFVIEVNNATTNDTFVTYGIPNGIFKFYPSYFSGSELFKSDIQNKLRIKFNYRLAKELEKTPILCTHNTFSIVTYITKGREIFLSCVSAQ